MPEVRIDPLSGQRVIIATDREVRTGAELQPAPDSPGGELPAGPDLFPALSPDAPAPAPEANRDLFWSGPARGAHEVIVNPDHEVRSLADLDVAGLIAAAETWRERMRAHAGAACLHLTVDEGPPAPGSTAGTQPHTRAQLYAFEFVPADIARERERFGAYAARTMGANLLGDLVQQEVRRRERIVAIDSEAVLLSAYAARVPFQLMLAPRAARMRFQDDGPTGAALLHDGLNRLRRALGAMPALNLWIRTAPSGAEHFCWRIDVLPRLVRPGGIELGAGVGLNPVSPEAAAAALRDAAG